MVGIVISVGTTLSIAEGTPATFDEAGFTAVGLVYTEVGEVTDVPEFGGEGTITEHISLKTGIVDKVVGSINYGDMTVPMASVWTDAGQIAVKSAFDGANARKTHCIKISHPDLGDVYVTSKVSGFKYNFGDANTVSTNSLSVAVTSKPVEVAAP